MLYEISFDIIELAVYHGYIEQRESWHEEWEELYTEFGGEAGTE